MDSVHSKQTGAVLVVGLVIMTVMTLLSLSIMRTSMTELQVAGNTEDRSSSFQAAEAGVAAPMSLVDTAHDPFDLSVPGRFTDSDGDGDVENTNPFEDVDPNPLANVKTHCTDEDDSDTCNPGVDVDINLTRADLPCARSAVASSEDILNCNFFEIVSVHAPADMTALRGGARTTLTEGVQKEIIEY